LAVVDHTTAPLVLLALLRTSFDVAREACFQLAGARNILCLRPLDLKPYGYPMHRDLLMLGVAVNNWTAMVGLLRGSGFVALVPFEILVEAADQSLVCVSRW
jgi:hypothetical protein